MRRLMRPALLLLLVAVVTLPAIADKAKDLYDKGQDAEARQQYEAAYDFFKQAYDLKPKDLRYRAAFERNRFEAAASASSINGQKLREDGKLDEAVAEFQKALAIDPSLFIAKQELNRTQKMINDQRNPPPQAAGPPAAWSAESTKRPGRWNWRPSRTFRSRSRCSRRSPMWSTAPSDNWPESMCCSIPITPPSHQRRSQWRHAGRGAGDHRAGVENFLAAGHSQYDFRGAGQSRQAQGTGTERPQDFLSYESFAAHRTAGCGECDSRRAGCAARAAVALAERAGRARDSRSDRAGGEIGGGSGQGASGSDRRHRGHAGQQRQVAYAGIESAHQRHGHAAEQSEHDHHHHHRPPRDDGNLNHRERHHGLNLNTLGNLNATDFQVTIPSANLSALMSNSDTKLIQNPQIRALDGQKASLKIGDRVPVATGSFQPGIGGVGINPLVNTQFQYLDVGVNIDITPHVHANGEVTLKISMDVSAVTGQQNIGGISQPIIGQRKIEHEIRLKDGEANLLGGIMEDQQTKSLSGIPGLAQIPILKYLFGQTSRITRKTKSFSPSSRTLSGGRM